MGGSFRCGARTELRVGEGHGGVARTVLGVVRVLRPDDLDRHERTVRIASQVDDAHATRAESFQQVVVPEARRVGGQQRRRHRVGILPRGAAVRNGARRPACLTATGSGAGRAIAAQELALAIAEEFVKVLPPGPRAARMREIRERLDETWFSWIGGRQTACSPR